MNDRERTNLIATRPSQSKGQVESFFFKISDPAGGAGLWIKFTLLVPAAPGAQPAASVWATKYVIGAPERCAAARNTARLSRCRFSFDAAGMEIGPCSFSPGRTRGRLVDAFGRVLEWLVEFDTNAESLPIFPSGWSENERPPRFGASSPYTDSRASGFFSIEGIKEVFHDLPCMQGHNWSPRHSPEYAWAHCNAFDQAPGVVFECVSACKKIGEMLSPPISMAILKIGRDVYAFNDPSLVLSQQSTFDRTAWTFLFHNDEWELRGRCASDRRFFTGLMYPNPDLTHVVCVNSNVADLELELMDRKTGDRIASLVSTRGAMLEFVTQRDWPDVCVWIPEYDPAHEAGALISADESST